MVDRLLLTRIHSTSQECNTRNVGEIVNRLREKFPEYKRLKMPVITRVVQGEFSPPKVDQTAASATTPTSSGEESSVKASTGIDTRGMNDALDNMYIRQSKKDGDGSKEEDEGGKGTVKKRKRARLQAGAYMNDLLAGANSQQKTFQPEPRPDLRLANVGGFEKVKADIEDLIIRPITHRDVYNSLGVSPPVGVLLHGPPGGPVEAHGSLDAAIDNLLKYVCFTSRIKQPQGNRRGMNSQGELPFIAADGSGKTMLATAIAGELGCPWFKVSAPEIVSGVSGESEATLRSLFTTAVSNAPCIVLIDEIDSICPRRETAAREMERRIVSQMQISMDGLWKTGVVVIGTTSRPDSVEPALRRSGRFDREIAMGMPDRAARAMILKTVTDGMSLANDVDLIELGKRCPGYVGADLSALAVEAAMCAAKRSVDALERGDGDGDNANAKITMDDFMDAHKKVQPSAKREGFSTVPDVSWKDVGSLSALKEELNDCICAPILHSEIHEKFGLTVPAGKSEGKGRPWICVWVRNLNQVFQRAATSSPCVIFFDEIDAIVPSRQNSDSNQSSERVVNQLLSELDGMNSRREVFVIAATNRPDIIDPAILRPGRLGRLLYVPLPDEAGRSDILATILKKLPVSDDVDVNELGARTVRFSGADLANLVREASMRAVKRIIQSGVGKDEVITANDFNEDGIDKLKLELKAKSRELEDARATVNKLEKRQPCDRTAEGSPVTAESILDKGDLMWMDAGQVDLNEFGEWEVNPEFEKLERAAGSDFNWDALVDRRHVDNEVWVKRYVSLLQQRLAMEPPMEATVSDRPPTRKLQWDCQSNPYMSGKRPSPARIVDLLPFAYELDILEVRFHELHSVVDVFVIVESTRAFKKWRKPLLLGSALGSKRFEKFRNKILYSVLDDAAVQRVDGMMHGRPEDRQVKLTPPETPLGWSLRYALETFTRGFLFEKYVEAFGEPDDNTLFIHGDMDEMPAGEQVAPFKYCQPKDTRYPVALPTRFLAMNFAWRRADMADLTFPNIFDRNNMQKHPISGARLPARTKGHWMMDHPTRGAHMSFFMPAESDLLKQLSFSDGGIIERSEDDKRRSRIAIALAKNPSMADVWRACGIRVCCWDDAQSSRTARVEDAWIPWYADLNRQRYPYMFPSEYQLRMYACTTHKIEDTENPSYAVFALSIEPLSGMWERNHLNPEHCRPAPLPPSQDGATTCGVALNWPIPPVEAPRNVTRKVPPHVAVRVDGVAPQTTIANATHALIIGKPEPTCHTQFLRILFRLIVVLLKMPMVKSQSVEAKHPIKSSKFPRMHLLTSFLIVIGLCATFSVYFAIRSASPASSLRLKVDSVQEASSVGISRILGARQHQVDLRKLVQWEVNPEFGDITRRAGEHFDWEALPDSHHPNFTSWVVRYVGLLQPLLIREPESSKPLKLTRPPDRPLKWDCLGNSSMSGPRPTPAKIVDLFLFAYEFDILEMRLYELDPLVDMPSAEQVATFKYCLPKDDSLPVILQTRFLAQNFAWAKLPPDNLLDAPMIFNKEAIGKYRTGLPQPSPSVGKWILDEPVLGAHISYFMPVEGGLVKQLSFSDGGHLPRSKDDRLTAITLVQNPSMGLVWKMCGIRVCCPIDSKRTTRLDSPTFIPWSAHTNRHRFPHLFPSSQALHACVYIRKQQETNRLAFDRAIHRAYSKGLRLKSLHDNTHLQEF
ncbi:hypothetical protein FOL47_005586 [Perkinsus chesapeaki]|uniref:AAA+ ATPase domain-containing protein n=1 Tax=Perkinsus chesapeaki TaxID=330153 RepID=A0A7J6LWS7_PERCH|nr:hypothetical protein FOL47_005586 [Perkinsus chesapeaki]